MDKFEYPAAGTPVDAALLGTFFLPEFYANENLTFMYLNGPVIFAHQLPDKRWAVVHWADNDEEPEPLDRYIAYVMPAKVTLAELDRQLDIEPMVKVYARAEALYEVDYNHKTQEHVVRSLTREQLRPDYLPLADVRLSH